MDSWDGPPSGATRATGTRPSSVDTEDTHGGKTGIVRMRRQLKHVKPYAPCEEAEREIKRLYVKRILR